MKGDIMENNTNIEEGCGGVCDSIDRNDPNSPFRNLLCDNCPHDWKNAHNTISDDFELVLIQYRQADC